VIQISSKRKGERGITILLVAVAMISILAMAALAVDVVALYVARSETQRAADAAALAAAKMFAFSGYTSNSSIITQGQLCVSGGSGNSAAANQAAQSAVSQNLVGGQVASLQSITCDFSQAMNPRVTITIQRTGLPTFFGRIWGAGAGSVSATASAEAFNPSGGSVNIAVASVKPWLINNDCVPSCGGPFYFTPTHGLVNSGAFIGSPIPIVFTEVDNSPSNTGPTAQNQFYAIDAPQPNVCPSNGALNCNQIGTGPPGIFYHDNIACANTAFQYSCGQQIGPGQPVQADSRSLGSIRVRTEQGTECLIHSSATDVNQGQDLINPGPPITLDGGTNNPNPALRSVSNISRSDSVVTVPVYDGTNLCPGGGCTVTTQVLGFLQLGIQAVSPSAWPGPHLPPPPPPGSIQAVILNAAPCDPANASGTPVAGGALSPLPVRLIR
jgi:Tfp pilus assembly protein PilE